MATNLQFIKSASGSGVSSLSVTDCFTANYDVYFVTVKGLDSTNDGDVEMRFIDSGGSVISASEYDCAFLQLKSNTSFAEVSRTNIDGIENIGVSNANDYGAGNGTYIFNPNDSSSFTFVTSQSAGYRQADSSMRGHKVIAVHKSAEQITGLNIFHESGLNLTLSISVYGVK